AVRSSHSMPPSSGTQHATTSPGGGGAGAHGLVSHDAPATTVPPPAVHSVAESSSSHSVSLPSSPVSFVQQTVGTGGGALAHGSGMQLAACVGEPPAAAQASEARSSHSAPSSSSGTQHAVAVGSVPSSGIAPTRTSWPAELRTVMRLPRG